MSEVSFPLEALEIEKTHTNDPIDESLQREPLEEERSKQNILRTKSFSSIEKFISESLWKIFDRMSLKGQKLMLDLHPSLSIVLLSITEEVFPSH